MCGFHQKVIHGAPSPCSTLAINCKILSGKTSEKSTHCLRINWQLQPGASSETSSTKKRPLSTAPTLQLHLCIALHGLHLIIQLLAAILGDTFPKGKMDKNLLFQGSIFRQLFFFGGVLFCGNASFIAFLVGKPMDLTAVVKRIWQLALYWS